MLLKVGELAKRTGLTVRTLHHYDSLGLLKPSTRSDAGYRLYNRDDVARLHAIQAMRQVGLPLADIAPLLEGNGEPLGATIQRQILALDRQIARAGELRDQLALLQTRLAEGCEPDMGKWLSLLERMATYNRYFSAAETRTILDNWKRVEASWPALINQVRDAMTRQVAPDSLELQPLARRWMELTHAWMGGDFDLMHRWNRMFMQEPVIQGRNGVDAAMSQYIYRGIHMRMEALRRHFTMEELSRFNSSLESEWQALAAGVEELLQVGTDPASPQAQAAVRQWDDLLERATKGDAGLRRKIIDATDNDPLLAAGAPLAPPLRAFLKASLRAGATLRTATATATDKIEHSEVQQ